MTEEGRLAQRAKVMIKRGRPKWRVCELLGITMSQLKYILNQGKEGKTPTLRQERGKPPKLPKDKLARIKTLSQFGDYTAREIADDVEVDIKHINAILQYEGF